MLLANMSPYPAQVRQYFLERGANLALCQMKRSKDNLTGYAFIRCIPHLTPTHPQVRGQG